MTPGEELREWFVTLSDMISGPLDEDCDLETGLVWFGGLDSDTIDQMQKLGFESSTMRRFLELGNALLEQVKESDA